METIWLLGESLVVVLNNPKKPPAEFGGIRDPTGARKKHNP